ncbi:MAG: flavin oxidoreductase/NADH oxidase, partial [Oscillospiraceae bacterium]
EPLIAYHNPLFEKENPISKDRIVSDEYLMELELIMGQASNLAEQAGFDGVDIKCCHRYLNSELLSAYTRKGEYGGSFQNRTRFLLNSMKNAINATSDNFIVTTRINIYDGFSYPYGFGVNEQDGLKPDLTEAKALLSIIHNELKVDLINITIGNPYVNPHVNRPADVVHYECEENPLFGVSRMVDCIKEVKKDLPNMIIIGSGLSYLRQFSANLAAGAILENCYDIAGFGREAFAYPEFANDILMKGEMDSKKCCITCSKCTELMRMGCVTGCVIRDNTYLPIYQKALKNI